jgi:SecD/SecF fusion protein
MLENAGRKVALIVILLLTSLGLMLVPDEPFQLGLDLQGGTRLVYSFDFETARENGQIAPNEDPQEILQQTVTILRNRVDPTGVKEPNIRTEGENRVIIELPGNLGSEGGGAESTLVGTLGLTDQDGLEVADASSFPETGVVKVGGESIRFGGLQGNRLVDLKRGHDGSPIEEHSTGQPVIVKNSDAFRAAIENLGELAFALEAEARDFTGSGTDLVAENEKLSKWQEANPGVPLTTFNALAPEAGGPDPLITWYPTRMEDRTGAPLPVLKAQRPQDEFHGGDLARVFGTQDRLGYPAVGFEMRSERIDDFSEFTGDNVNRMMLIILNGEVRVRATLNSKLVGSGIIEGRFTPEEVKNHITVLRSGSLKLKPKLENDERVGATLGDDYVARGEWSGLVAIGIVMLFMALYYRRLGVIAAISLFCNIVMFLGGLAFLHATLTLPGIAGIVLTVGMAVDANILIFDRLREESEKGRNVKQAAKAGFEKALSAIVDSNVTTFLTAVVLYKLGTGPVRGFAVTLMIGIVTSVFAALVTTRTLVHYALEKRGAQPFKMGRWLADAKYDFMGKTKAALVASTIVIVGGLIAFFMLEDKEKLGIDFTGGIEAQIVTAKPESVETIRGLVSGIEAGDIGRSAEVRTVPVSAKDDGYTQFRMTFKAVSTDEDVEGRSLRPEVRKALASVLLSDPVRADVRADGDVTRADLTLFFKDLHDEADVQARLESAGLRDVTVLAGADKGVYTASATTAAGRSAGELTNSVSRAFEDASDSAGKAFDLAEPIPVWSQVGPQVVGELRDKALLALAVSIFITVLYIRVRFAEYSYGIAAVVALVHDVLVTLAAISIGNHLGIVNGEINLAMIAVFLTIIGYSINDTIVIFDRVRENLPRMQRPLREVLNVSINETLSRTIMTSGTTFLAIVIQYAFNAGTENILESISFAMIFGVVTGTYSTIFIANPVFLWLENRAERAGAGRGAQARAKREIEEQKRIARDMKAEEEGLQGTT